MKTKIAIIGSGNIGWALKQLLKEDYDIKQGDITDGFDATDISQVKEFLDGVDAVISAGPFAVNKNIEPCFGCRPRSGFSCLWSSLISLDSFSVPELLIKFRPSLVAIGENAADAIVPKICILVNMPLFPSFLSSSLF